MSQPSFVRKGLLRLSWPLLAVTVFTLLAALGNVVLLSQASPDLNAAVATANQLLGVLYDISVIFSLGALVVVAQYLGAGSIDSARRAGAVALRASSILGLTMAIGIALTAPVTTIFLMRAALFRERQHGNPTVPPPSGLPQSKSSLPS